jgi:hypothetical protein
METVLVEKINPPFDSSFFGRYGGVKVDLHRHRQYVAPP